MDYEWLNVISLVLGLAAWVLPLIGMTLARMNKHTAAITLSITSMSAALICLCLQITYQNHLVNKLDWSALQDTSGALVLVSVGFVAMCILLNIVAITTILKQQKNK